MAANRSRTERWRDCLWKIYERGGGLEFAVDRHAGTIPLDQTPRDLVWRVRVLGLSDSEIVVELPGALGKTFQIEAGTALVGIMAVGQNKWMFQTTAIGPCEVAGRSGPTPAMRVRMPDHVERCQRRTFDRISTASIELPVVECWPLLDPRTAAPAEIANRVHILDLLDRDLTGEGSDGALDKDTMPEVGPMFNARMANIGGGGVGLQIVREDAGSIETARLFWLRIDLRPIVPAPLALTARLAHTHIDSRQNIYAGMAFDFGLNPSHKSFVINQIERCLRLMQRREAA